MSINNAPVVKRTIFVDSHTGNECFDRKADYGWRHPIVEHLRMRGWNRRLALKRADLDKSPYPNKWYGLESTGMYAFHFMDKKGKTFLDLGCGYSPDAHIATMQGCKKAYRLDLIETPDFQGDNAEFVQADFVEGIPLKDSSVDMALCQAALNLVRPEERMDFYKHVYRVLKPGGFFSFYMCNLRNDWYWNLKEEKEKMREVGFSEYDKFAGGALMIKGDGKFHL